MALRIVFQEDTRAHTILFTHARSAQQRQPQWTHFHSRPSYVRSSFGHHGYSISHPQIPERNPQDTPLQNHRVITTRIPVLTHTSLDYPMTFLFGNGGFGGGGAPRLVLWHDDCSVEAWHVRANMPRPRPHTAS